MSEYCVYLRHDNHNSSLPLLGSIHLVRNGQSATGKNRCRCRDCKKSFQIEYSYKACSGGVREQIKEMSMNGSGIRDTARVLGVDKNTVLSTLKKTKLVSLIKKR